MPYITDSELKGAIAARMGTPVADLDKVGAHWGSIVAEANESAYQIMRTILITRGYTAAQINAWPPRKTFNLLIGCCHALRAVSANKQIDPSVLTSACSAEDMLQRVIVTGVDDAPVEATGFVDGGAMDNSGEECFLNQIRHEREDPCCGH